MRRLLYVLLLMWCPIVGVALVNPAAAAPRKPVGKSAKATSAKPRSKAAAKAERARARARAQALPKRGPSAAGPRQTPRATDVAAPALAPGDLTAPKALGAIKRRSIHYEDVPLNETERQLTSSLSLQVDAGAAYELWRVTLENSGTRVVRLFDDPRLLWFSATVPGQKRPVACELPDPWRLRDGLDEARVALAPGSKLVFDIEPRFYCFSSGDTTTLVPGAELVAHYGWQQNQRLVWERGQQRLLRLQQNAPFVARADGDPEPEIPETGLKELQSAPFALGSAFSSWAKARLPDAVHPRGRADLELRVTRGSDAESPQDLTVDVTLENRSQLTQRVRLQSDLMSFEIHGPGGKTRCAPPVELRNLDEQSLTRLGPGRSLTVPIRLMEFCPDGTFATAGGYYVRAELPIAQGAEPALTLSAPREASTAPFLLKSEWARPVRLRRAEASYVHWKPTPDIIGAASVAPSTPAGSLPPADR